MFLDKQGMDDKALTVVSQSAICSIYVSFGFGGIAPKENVSLQCSSDKTVLFFVLSL